MAFADGTVWVTSYDGFVDRVDAGTNTVAASYPLSGNPCGIGVDDQGTIWVAVLGDGRVDALDAKTGKVVHSITGVGPHLWDLKVHGRDVWVVDRDAGQLLHIDATTAMITMRVPIGPSGAGLAVFPDRVWVADSVDGQVRAVDPKTGDVRTTADAGVTATWFADDGQSTLAIAARSPGTVATVDADSGALGPAVGGWIQPLDGTIIGTSAWVPDGGGGVVRVLDLTSGTITSSWTLPGARQPFVAEPGFGDVWVSDSGGDSLWRIKP